MIGLVGRGDEYQHTEIWIGNSTARWDEQVGKAGRYEEDKRIEIGMWEGMNGEVDT